MRSALKDPLILTTFTFNLLGRAIAAVPPDEPNATLRAPRVARQLLLRVANDLRAASRIARLGYPLQAATIVASLYEAALCVIHIGTDEARTQTWINHDDPTRTPWTPKQLTRSAAQKFDGDPVKTAEMLYQRYTQLCMAKHVHPIAEMQHAVRIAPRVLLSTHGPDWSERSEQTASFALLHGVGLALLAHGVFMLDHVPPSIARNKLLETRALLDRKRRALNAAAAQRWGAKDPFPGKWVRFTRPKGT
jgi:hypothetical protein